MVVFTGCDWIGVELKKVGGVKVKVKQMVDKTAQDRAKMCFSDAQLHVMDNSGNVGEDS